MSPTTKKGVVTILVAGFVYGLMMVVISVLMGDPVNLPVLLISSSFFGFFMGLTSMFYQKRYAKVKGSNDEGNSLKVNHKLRLRITLPPHLVAEALRQDEVLGKLTMKETDGLVRLSTGMSMRSWGEKMSVKLVEVESDAYEYEIASAPKLKTTLIDYGKNFENVDRIKAAMLRALPTSTPPAAYDELDLIPLETEEQRILRLSRASK